MRCLRSAPLLEASRRRRKKTSGFGWFVFHTWPLFENSYRAYPRLPSPGAKARTFVLDLAKRRQKWFKEIKVVWFVLWGLLWAEFTSPLYLVTCIWKASVHGCLQVSFGLCVFGTADSSTGLSGQNCGQGTKLFWLLPKLPKCKAAPALGPLRAVLCGSQQAQRRVWDSKPRNYLVPWSDLMICVWLLSSHTTQLCNRVFGFFYVLDQGLCIILCLWKDFWPFLHVASFPQFWNTNIR